MTFVRKLSAAVAAASLFAAALALAGNRDGFEPERQPLAKAAKPGCESCPNMARGDGSGGDAGDRTSTLPIDSFDRSMDAGG